MENKEMGCLSLRKIRLTTLRQYSAKKDRNRRSNTQRSHWLGCRFAFQTVTVSVIAESGNIFYEPARTTNILYFIYTNTNFQIWLQQIAAHRN